jgi:hypothetical protein
MLRWRQVKGFEQIDPADIAIAIPRTRANGAARRDCATARYPLFLQRFRRDSRRLVPVDQGVTTGR